MSYGLTVVGPQEKCDRCGHRSNQHAMPVSGSICLVAEGPKVAGAKAKRCWCDGFFPRPA